MSDDLLVCGEREIACLAKKDKALGRFMTLAGPISRTIIPDPFQGLVHAIIGQQISGKAHASVWNRFLQSFDLRDAAKIASLEPEQLRLCGISGRKAGYILGIARAFASGAMAGLESLADDDLAHKLVQMPGVGQWTAEMLLIFTFKRPNVISFGDFGIRRGLRMLYRHREITPQMFDRYRKRYQPFATVASLYLWELAGGGYAAYRDPARMEKAGQKPGQNIK